MEQHQRSAIADGQRAIVSGERPTFHVLAAPLLAGWELTIDELPGVRVPVLHRPDLMQTAQRLIAGILAKPIDSFEVDLAEVRLVRRTY